MIPATLKAIDCTEMMLLWCLIEKFVLKFGFEKRGIFTKFHFYIKRSMEISGKRFLHFYQQASSLIGNRPNHRTNMVLPYYSNSCYESDYERICIVINGKIRSVTLNIFSSVYAFPKIYLKIKMSDFEAKNEKNIYKYTRPDILQHQI